MMSRKNFKKVEREKRYILFGLLIGLSLGLFVSVFSFVELFYFSPYFPLLFEGTITLILIVFLVLITLLTILGGSYITSKNLGQTAKMAGFRKLFYLNKLRVFIIILLFLIIPTFNIISYSCGLLTIKYKISVSFLSALYYLIKSISITQNCSSYYLSMLSLNVNLLVSLFLSYPISKLINKIRKNEKKN